MKLLLGCAGPRIRNMASLAFGLRWPDATTITAQDGVRMTALIAKEKPDVIILDPHFADMSAAAAIKQARRLSDVPLMVVAGEWSELEAVEALESGADDYIAAPNHYVDLVARIVALLRRVNVVDFGITHPLLVSGGLLVNPATFEAFLDEEKLELTTTEFRLLQLLMSHYGSVVTYELAERVIWSGNGAASELVKKYVMRLRRKLGDVGERSSWFLNVYGIGYRFTRAVGANTDESRFSLAGS
jgi:DNA-binding response OmpR family regulator